MSGLPSWTLIQGVLFPLVLPAFVAAALGLAVTCAVTKSAPVRIAGSALALIAGLAVGNHFRDLLEWWPRRSGIADALGLVPWWAIDRGWPALLPVTAAAALIGVPAVMLTGRAWYLGVALRVAAAAGAAWWLVEALPPLSIAWTFAVLFTGMALNHEALVFATRRAPGLIPMLAVLIAWGGTAATVLIFAHSARFSDLAALMAASLCGAGMVAAIWRIEPAAFFAASSAFLPPLMLAGAANTYSEVPLAAFACAAFAPCALWLLRFPPLSRWQTRVPVVAAIIAFLIPCAAAVVLAARFEKLEFES